MPKSILRIKKIIELKPLHYILFSIIFLLSSFVGYISYDINFSKLLEGDVVNQEVKGVTAPNVLSFQGRMTDRSDTPITSPVSVTFNIYSVPTGGTALWTGTCSITPDQDGIFETLLGGTCGTSIPTTIFSENIDTYLGITVGSDSEMIPRQKIVSSAYALNADTLDGFDSSQTPGIGNVVVLDTSGNLTFGVTNPVISSSGDIILSPTDGVGINTTDPLAKLDVLNSTGDSFRAGNGTNYFFVNQTGSAISVIPANQSYFSAYSVQASADTYSRLGLGLDTGSPYIALGPGNTDKDIFLKRDLGDFTISFGTTPSEKFRFTSAGYLGIGTPTPSVALDVVGDIKASGTIRNVTVSGTVAETAATVAKTTTISNYTLTTGDLLSITFTSGNTAAAATLNVNGTGAKNIRLGNTNVTAVNMTLAAGSTILMYYDGTYFQIMGSQRLTDTDTNTYDRTYWNNAITAGVAIYDYKIVMQASNGKWYPLTLETGTGNTKTVSTQPFVINSPILYYATTTDVAANGTFANVYSEYPMTTLTYTANTSSWTNQQPIYLKGTINSNGEFVLDNTTYSSFISQTLPTSDDGFVYILLGEMYSTVNMRLFQYHPMYEYKDGRVRPYGQGSTTFAGLTDTPSAYTSSGGYLVRVNAGATGLEFVEPGLFTDTNDYVDSVSFNSSDGVLTLGRTGALADLTADLDGRYALLSAGMPSGTEGQMLYNNAGTWTAFSGMYWDDVNSRLGIGTSTPSKALEVNGDIMLTGGSNRTISVAGSSDLYVKAGSDVMTAGDLNLLGGSTTSGDYGGHVIISGGHGGAIGGNVIINGGFKDITETYEDVILASVGGMVGIGDTTPSSLLTVGNGDLFQVNRSGDLIKIKNVTYSWPSSNGAGVLTNNGSGTLSWNDISASLLPTGTEGQMLYNNAGTWTAYNGMYWNDTYNRLGINKTSPSVALDVAGQARFVSTTFPVVDIYRETNGSAGSIYGGAKLERLMSGGTATNGTGIGFYFKAPDNTGVSTFAGMFGGALYDVTNGSEKGEIVFGASWTGADPYATRHLVIQATGASSSRVLIPNGTLGVNTTSTSYTLDVNGSARISTLSAGTSDSVVINSSGVLQSRTIDSRVWGSSSLVDGSGTANQLAYWSDSNTLGSLDYSTWDTNSSNDITSFLGLTDTPSAYTGLGTYLVRVNSGATALEFVEASTFTDTDDQRWNEILDPNANKTFTMGSYITNFTFNSLTNTTGYGLSSSSLTSGNILGISSSSTGFTGSLGDITLSGSNAANTGSLLTLNNTGTLNTNTTFLINHYAEGTGNLAFRVNDESGDTTPFVIDGEGNIGIGRDSVLAGAKMSFGAINNVDEGNKYSIYTIGEATNYTDPVGNPSNYFGLYNEGSSEGVSSKTYGVYNNQSTDEGTVYGIYNEGYSEGSGSFGGSTFGVYNKQTIGSYSEGYGIYNQIQLSPVYVTLPVYGIYTNLNTVGTFIPPTSYANYVLTSGSGTQYAYYANMASTTATEWGVYITGEGQNYLSNKLGIGDTSPASLLTVGNGDLFQVNSSGDLIKIKNVTYSWPSSNGSGVLTNNGSGTLTWAAASGATAWDDIGDPDANSSITHGAFTSEFTYNTFTSGSAFKLSSSSTGFTGSLLDLSLTGDNVANIGNLLTLYNTGTLNANTSLLINHYATGTNNLAFRINDESADTTPFVIDGAGNVGIGTSTPTEALEINGNLKFAEGADRTISIANSSGPVNGHDLTIKGGYSQSFQGGDLFLYGGDAGGSNPGGNVYIKSGGNDISGNGSNVYIDGDRNDSTSSYVILQQNSTYNNFVGIGTTSPDYKLQVNGVIAPETTDQDLGTSSLRWDIFANAIDSDAASSFTGGATVRGLIVDHATTTYDRILTTVGAVGTARFDGTITNADLTAARSWTFPDTTGTVALTSQLFWTRNGTTLYPTTSGDSVLPNGTANLGSDTSRWADLFLSSSTLHLGSSTTDEGIISYDTTNNIFKFDTDSTTNGDISFLTDDLYLDKSSGNIGIGTTSPSSSLQINAPNGVTGLTINGGATDNTDLFKMVGNANTQRLILERSGGATTFLEAGGSIGLFGTTTNHDFRIRTNYTDRMSITTAGYVGIGDISPTSLLTVGNGDLFQVNSSGDLIKIKNVTYSWPSSNSSGVLTNNGSGTLTWAAAAGATLWNEIVNPNANKTFTMGSYTTDFQYNTFTSGSAYKLSSSSTGFTGSLLDLSLTGSNAANIGNLLTLYNTGADNANTSLLINHYATGTNNLAFRVNDESGDTTPFVIDGEGNVGVGTDTPTATLSVQGAIQGGEDATTTGINNFTFGVGGQPAEVDTSFKSGAPSSTVYAIATQSDGKIVIGGSFATYAGTSRQRVARLNSDGSLDTSFDSSSGASSTVYAIAIQSDGKIIIGGAFTSYAGTTRQNVARLNSDGSLDTSFDSSSGAGGDVNAVVIQSDGKIIIGGVFTTYAGTTRQRVARLNSDGSLDTSFDSSSGAGGTVNGIALQSDGKIVIVGVFLTYSGTTRGKVARLNSDGSLDTSFDSTTGVSGSASSASSVAIQSDGKVVVVGYFIGPSAGVARFNTDGSPDASFSGGTTAWVRALAIQSDGKIIIGGSFTLYVSTTRQNIARLNSNGSIDASFDSSYGTTSGVYSLAIQSDGKILVGGVFSTYAGVSGIAIVRLFSNQRLTNYSSNNFLVGFGGSNMIFDNIGFALEGLGNITLGASSSSFTDSKLAIVGNGDTSSTHALKILNKKYQNLFNITDAGGVRITSFGAGTVISDASGNLSVSSDENLKDIKGDFTKGLNEILQINPILYNWNELSQMDMLNTYAGFSAQNVQLAIPEAVGVDINGFLSLSDRPILAATVNAIKEQQGMISSLSSNLSSLSGFKVASDTINGGNIRFNTELKTLEYSNDGIQWYTFANNQSLILLSSRVDDLETRISTLEQISSRTDSNTLNILKVKLNSEGNIELLGGNILMEGDGTLSIKKLKLEENYSIGSSKILANTTSIVINTKAITTDSKVFINPTSDTLNKVLFVTELKVGESFKVNINGVLPQDITFDWFIIDSNKPLEEIPEVIQPIVEPTPIITEPVVEPITEPIEEPFVEEPTIEITEPTIPEEPIVPEEIPIEETVTP